MVTRNRLLAALLGLGALVAAGAAEAQRGGRGDWAPPSVGSNWSQEDARNAVREGRHRPLRQLLRGVQARYPGEMVGEEPRLEERGGRAVYRLRWRTPDGRLLDLAVDAESGQVMQ